MKLTCGSFLFDLLQFGERGRGQHLQIHTFPHLKELHQTVHRQLQDQQQETHFRLTDVCDSCESCDVRSHCGYRVVDDLNRLRVDSEQLVGRTLLRVQLKHNAEQRGGGVSH